MFSQYAGGGHASWAYVQDQKRTQEVGDRARAVITLRLLYSNTRERRSCLKDPPPIDEGCQVPRHAALARERGLTVAQKRQQRAYISSSAVFQ